MVTGVIDLSQEHDFKLQHNPVVRGEGRDMRLGSIAISLLVSDQVPQKVT